MSVNLQRICQGSYIAKIMRTADIAGGLFNSIVDELDHISEIVWEWIRACT